MFIAALKFATSTLICSKTFTGLHDNPSKFAKLEFKTNRLSLQTIAGKIDWLQLVSKWYIVLIDTLSSKQVKPCSRYSMVTLCNGADSKVEVANFVLYILYHKLQTYCKGKMSHQFAVTLIRGSAL